MQVKATRIVIQSAHLPTLWYAKKINEQYWANFVGSDFGWKIIQEGTTAGCALYVHNEDCTPLRESIVNVDLLQTVTEAS